MVESIEKGDREGLKILVDYYIFLKVVIFSQNEKFTGGVDLIYGWGKEEKKER